MSAMTTNSEQAKLLGDELVVDHAQGQIRAFFEELRHGARNYQTVASLNAQIAQEYRGRCILELLQNAHDALANARPEDPRRISFILNTEPRPVLLVANSGLPFHHEDFKGICQLAQSPKDPNKSVGNKGLGFRSVLEVTGCPEVWSTTLDESAPSFAFRFDPAVIDLVAEAAQELERCGADARSPFKDCPLVDWSTPQLEEFQRRLATDRIDAAEAARELSPYAIPLRAKRMPTAVRCLLDEGHATVIRLPLDSEEAVRSVKEQLDKLRDARSVVFLEHLGALAIEADGERCVLGRMAESDVSLAGSRTRQRQLRVIDSVTETDNAQERRFHVWTRVVGGCDDPDGAADISAAVAHLPNRWPEVRKATVGVAVEDTLVPTTEGVFVIFLPTEKTTGTGAHVNAPFYGSLDRRQIDFNEPYNELLLNGVLTLCLDAVQALAAGSPEEWRARAILDMLAPTGEVSGERWSLISKLLEHSVGRGDPLDDQALVLCDKGWCIPGLARIMPSLDDDDPIGADRWREQAAFAVVAKELDRRRGAVGALIKELGGVPDPTNSEWTGTIESMAVRVKHYESGVGWDDFLRSLVAILPQAMRSPSRDVPNPLVDTRFVPTADGRLVAASDAMKLFFQPVQGVDDSADLVAEVPETLKDRIAFLHPGVRTHEGQERTGIQGFLDRGKFALAFRREDILENVVIPALPKLPASHGSSEADSCAAILAWTLTLLGDDPTETMLQLLGKLPVPCRAGWQPMAEATFGPGWPGRLGDDLDVLTNDLASDAGDLGFSGTILLPPDNEHWQGIVVRGDLLARAGVVDGLRLSTADVSFRMDENRTGSPSCPAGVPSEAWSDWFEFVKPEFDPPYLGLHEYVFRVQLQEQIHHLATLRPSGRLALSRLIVASLCRWSSGWESVVIYKRGGRDWHTRTPIDSPLKHWLRTFPWLCDDQRGPIMPISRRWLVPESLLRGQGERYSYIDPLPLALAHELSSSAVLLKKLVELGLNVYPTEGEDVVGPELLDALGSAWAAGRVRSGRFDVFLGQVRDGWRHWDPERGLPGTFPVRTGQREFTVRGADELADVYLPDDRDRARTLREYGMPILEMNLADAGRLADVVVAATGVKRASLLEERHVIDGTLWDEQAGGALTLDEAEYQWLPVVLLSVAAHGGNSPTGASTKGWRDAQERLRRARVLMCEEISIELVDGDLTVGSSDPMGTVLSGGVLAVRRDMESYEDLASATQALLDRQDLLKDLRLVLGALPAHGEVTAQQIEQALARAEIDSQALADVRQRWAGNTGLLVDRVRPVLMLLGIPEDGLGVVAGSVEGLADWLSANVPQWPTPDLVAAAHTSRDDHEMGEAAWAALGDVAELPAWNAALEELGDRYESVRNRRVLEQTRAHLDEVKAALRGLARHIAVEVGDPRLFRQIEAVSQNFSGNTRWAAKWWKVPFDAVLRELHHRFAEIPGVGPRLAFLEGVVTVDALRYALQERGIEVAPDPYEVASENVKRLEGTLEAVIDLHEAWIELDQTRKTQQPRPDMPGGTPAEAYVRRWAEAELVTRAIDALGDVRFKSACNGCSTIEAIRERLGLVPAIVASRREERRMREQEAERESRTFDVAGTPFVVGGDESYGALFDRLGELPIPEGPQDELTPLAKMRSSSGKRAGRSAGQTTPTPPRPPAELRELVGIVGEIRAYYFLQQRFGEDAVNRDAWVSEIRRMVLPLVGGETTVVSDSHGFDFQFTHRRRKMHVEVKATSGDDAQFELGISEIKAASRLARRGLWRILRIRRALSDYPEFDLLPNPFEDRFRERYRLQRGGMWVSYSRKQ